MNFTAALLSPLLLLFHGGAHGAGTETEETQPAIVDPIDVQVSGESEVANAWPEPIAIGRAPEWAVTYASHAFLPDAANQVRIEQRTIIRITPRAPGRTRTDVLAGLPGEASAMRFSERKIGKCLSVASIAGVQPDRDNRLLLFTRDRQIVGAELEKACRAKDFYSGFYLASPSDGRLCVDRDTLQSRSGANCKLSRIRQLIPED